jgi:lipoprotein NlpD
MGEEQMVLKQWLAAGRLAAGMVAALLVVGCANTRPAPVVNRTNMPPTEIATVPSQPLPPAMQDGQVLPGQVAGQPPAEQPPGVEISPIRSGGIESGSVVSGAAPVDPNLKTAPKGLKRPYGELAAVDPGAGAAATPPAVVTTTAPPSAVTAPAKPAPGATGLLDGVAFAWPASGTVLQNFDETSSKGLSLGGKAGDIVRAAADGRVIFSGAGPRGYGNLVIVKHDNELLSVYAHNRSLAVKEGESVKRGQKIAELGNSGTDKPKLHFEIRQQGKPIDPLAVLPKR